VRGKWVRGACVRTALVLLPLAGAPAACAREAAAPARADAPAMRVRDSAGVRLVQAGFAPEDSGPLLRVTDTLLDGRRPTDEGIIGLGSVQPFADSSLVVFSGSGPSVLQFAASGGLPRMLGRPEAADGGVGARSTLLPYTGDTLLLWDAEAGTLSRVTPGGIGTPLPLAYPRPQLTAVSGVLRDGTVIGVTIASPGEQGPGHARAAAAMLRFAPDGAFVDTIARLRGPERVVQRTGASGELDRAAVRATSVPFGRTTLWTVGQASVLLLDTEACVIERRDAAGAVLLRLDAGCPVAAVTEEDRDRFLAEVLATARSRADSSIRRRFVAEATFPPSKSTASGLLTDAYDRIWLRLPVEGIDEPWRWQVFDADGTPITTLRLGREWRIVAVRDADLLVAASERDDAPPAVARVALPAPLVARR
jgi:hypothetical protein